MLIMESTLEERRRKNLEEKQKLLETLRIPELKNGIENALKELKSQGKSQPKIKPKVHYEGPLRRSERVRSATRFYKPGDEKEIVKKLRVKELVLEETEKARKQNVPKRYGLRENAKKKFIFDNSSINDLSHD